MEVAETGRRSFPEQNDPVLPGINCDGWKIHLSGYPAHRSATILPDHRNREPLTISINRLQAIFIDRPPDSHWKQGIRSNTVAGTAADVQRLERADGL
jgi:hypothetical protein